VLQACHQRELKPECLRRSQIDEKFKFGGSEDRQVGGLFALKNSTGIEAGLAIHVLDARPIRHEAACHDVLAQCVNCWQRMVGRQRHDARLLHLPTGKDLLQQAAHRFEVTFGCEQGDLAFWGNATHNTAGHQLLAGAKRKPVPAVRRHNVDNLPSKLTPKEKRRAPAFWQLPPPSWINCHHCKVGCAHPRRIQWCKKSNCCCNEEQAGNRKDPAVIGLARLPLRA